MSSTWGSKNTWGLGTWSSTFPIESATPGTGMYGVFSKTSGLNGILSSEEHMSASWSEFTLHGVLAEGVHMTGSLADLPIMLGTLKE